jgi:hypothetical protein
MDHPGETCNGQLEVLVVWSSHPTPGYSEIRCSTVDARFDSPFQFALPLLGRVRPREASTATK